MNFEQLEKATPAQLREAAKSRFDITARDHRIGNIMLSLEAQFYMAEMDRREAEIERRESRRVANRDFRMELIVIALIGLELIVAIWGVALSIRESRQQFQTMERLVHALDKLERR